MWLNRMQPKIEIANRRTLTPHDRKPWDDGPSERSEGAGAPELLPLRIGGVISLSRILESPPASSEILAVASEIAALSDVPGLEPSMLEFLVRAALLVDRENRGVVPCLPVSDRSDEGRQ